MGKTAAQHIGDIRTAHKKTVRDIVQRIAYAFGNLGQAAFYNTMSTFFITYVTTSLFINVDRSIAARLISVIT